MNGHDGASTLFMSPVLAARRLHFLGLLAVLGRIPWDTFIKSCCSRLPSDLSFFFLKCCRPSSEQLPHFGVAMATGATKQLLSSSCCVVV